MALEDAKQRVINNGIHLPELAVWVLNGEEAAVGEPLSPISEETVVAILRQFDAAARDFALVSIALDVETDLIMSEYDKDYDDDLLDDDEEDDIAAAIDGTRERRAVVTGDPEERVHFLLQKRRLFYRGQLQRLATAFAPSMFEDVVADAAGDEPSGASE